MNVAEIGGRRRVFAEKVAEGHTATDAYLLAGYRAAKRETAHRAASRLYANPGIRAHIRDLRRTGDELAREETTLTIARKLAFLARLVLTSSATLHEDDPLIQSHRLLKDGSTSVRMPCKLKALKMHSELAGHFLPEPTPQPPPIDPLQELFDQIRKGAAPEATPATETRNPAPQRNEPSPQYVPTGTHWPLAKDTSEQKTNPLPTTTDHVGETTHEAGSRPCGKPEAPQFVPTTGTPEEAQARRVAPPSEYDDIASKPHRPLVPSVPIPNPTAERAPSPEPLTPTQVRRLVQAQLKQESSLSHAYSGPPQFPTLTIRRP